MSELDPLDPELRALWALERGAYAEDTFARDAVLRRIQAAIVLAPLATGAVGAAAAASSGTTAASGAAGANAKTAAAGAAGVKTKLALALGWKGAALVTVVAFGSGVAVGEGGRKWTDPGLAPVTTSRAPAAASERAMPSVSSPVRESPEPSSATSVSSPAPSGASSTWHRPTDAPPISAVNDERVLVDTARTALARGLASDALAAIEQHAKRFPRGRLAEEREALAVQALVLAGDRNAAEARATRFRRTFPSSIFRSAVDRAVISGNEEKNAAP